MLIINLCGWTYYIHVYSENYHVCLLITTRANQSEDKPGLIRVKINHSRQRFMAINPVYGGIFFTVNNVCYIVIQEQTSLNPSN